MYMENSKNTLSEGARIQCLFKELYDGSPWIGVSIVPNLKVLTSDKAAARALPACNSIWEIVNHLISWRANVLERLNGKLRSTPQNNYIQAVKDTSSENWNATLKALEQSQHQWLSYLDTINERDFEKVYPPNEMSYYDHIHGILQHDAYHLGQIVLLLKFV